MQEKENDMKKGSGHRKEEGPDGTLAWIVALAACAINFIMAGLSRMSGILYVAFIEEYGVDRKSASTPFSVRSSIGNLLGPVVGIFGQKYGVRAVTVTGGIVGTLSAACCFFADDINWITFLWGGLNGAASAFTVVLPQVSIGEYFQEYRTTASGLAFSGGCFGSFVFPSLLEHFLEGAGIEGTFLLMAAIIANTIPAAMILRSPPWKKNANNQAKSAATAKKAKVSDCGSEGKGSVSSPLYGVGERPDVGFLKHNTDLIVRMLNVKPPCESAHLAVPWQDYNSKPVSALEVCIAEELEDMFRCLQFSGERNKFVHNYGENMEKPLQSPFKQRSVHTDTKFKHGFGSLFRASSAPDVSKISKDISSSYVLQKMRDLLALDKAQVWACFPEENRRKIYRLLKEVRKLYNSNADRFGNRRLCPPPATRSSTSEEAVFDEAEEKNGFLDLLKTAFILHANPLFMLICLCRAVHFITFIPVMTTVVDFVMDKGLPEYQGKYAIAALSVGDLLGRLCLGWVTDRGYMPLPRYMLTVMVMQGLSTAALPLVEGPLPLFAAFAVFGALQGSLFVRQPVLVAKYMRADEQAIAMGCVSFLSGILGFGVPYYIGYFRDTLGSYDYIFYINGVMGAVVGLLWALEPYFLRRACGKHSVSDDTV